MGRSLESQIKAVKAERKLDLARLDLLDAHRAGVRLLDLPILGIISWGTYARCRNFDFGHVLLETVDTAQARRTVREVAGRKITLLRQVQAATRAVGSEV